MIVRFEVKITVAGDNYCHTFPTHSYLVARARVVALRSFSVAPIFDFNVGCTPAFYPELGSHQRGAHAKAIVIAELTKTRTKHATSIFQAGGRGNGWLHELSQEAKKRYDIDKVQPRANVPSRLTQKQVPNIPRLNLGLVIVHRMPGVNTTNSAVETSCASFEQALLERAVRQLKGHQPPTRRP